MLLVCGMTPAGRLPGPAALNNDAPISPKSNSSYLAFNEAMKDIEEGRSGNLPLHLKNTYSFDGKYDKYKYPHDYPGGWVNQQYLPDEIKDHVYYIPKTTSKYEEALKERYEAIEKAKASRN